MPYHGFAFVQPPGILLLMAPVAVIAKVSTATHAMAAARLLTVFASTRACRWWDTWCATAACSSRW